MKAPVRREDLPPAFQALLACCRHPLTDADRVHLEACLRLPVDWDAFLRLADRHRIQPQVLASLRQVAPGLVPERVAGALDGTVKDLTRRTLALSGELVRLLGLFRQAGLPVVVLKGPPLSLELFGDVAMRSSKDLDLLVKLEDLERADTLLLGQGCTRMEGALSPRQLRRLSKTKHHFAYVRRDGLLVELHLRPFQPDAILPAREVRGWFDEACAGGFGAPVLEPATLFAYLCVHGSVHRWFRLKWLADLEAILKRLDRAEGAAWVGRVRDLGLERMAAEGLILVRDYLGAELAPDLAAFVAATPLPAGFVEASQRELLDGREPGLRPWQLGERLAFVRHTMTLRAGPRLKLALLQELLVTEEPILMVDLPGVLYPLYYVLRPLLWVRRHLARGPGPGAGKAPPQDA